MDKQIESKYVKRTQKDYSMAFKLSVVREVERGELSIGAAARKYGIQNHSTVTTWLRKYGSFDWENQTPSNMPQPPEQKIMALEQKVRLLEKQKNFLEQQVETSEKKAIIFDMIIELAEEDGAARAVQDPDKKKRLTRVIDRFTVQQKETLVSACGLLGVDRQVNYRSKRSKTHRQQVARQVVGLVQYGPLTTYIGSRGKHACLCLVTDVYSKKIVGHDLSDSLSAEGAMRALKMAVRQKAGKEPLIHHRSGDPVRSGATVLLRRLPAAS